MRQGIRDWPVDDRPREKLFHQGEHALSNAELLALLIGSGPPGETAVDVARRLLKRFQTLKNMSHLDARDWRGIKGLGPAKIALLRAAFELARRFSAENGPSKRTIHSPREAADMLRPSFRGLKKEMFKVVFLDSAHRVLKVENCAQGTVNAAYPILREVFHAALQVFASALILAHNHPSGRLDPSPEDRRLTHKAREAGQILGIRVLDHLIVTEEGFFSFEEDRSFSLPI